MTSEANNPTYKPLTSKELIETFPEAVKILPKLVAEWKGKILDIKGPLTQISESDMDAFSKWFYLKAIEVFMPTEPFKQIERLERLKQVAKIIKPQKNGQPNPRQKEYLDVERAKAVPIEQIYNFEKEFHFSKKIKAVCPFHAEDTPSFFIYRDTNTYHCFGCKESGDVIKFVMTIQQTDFNSAVKYLMGV